MPEDREDTQGALTDLSGVVLVVLHFHANRAGYPSLYVSAPGALPVVAVSVDDNAPDDHIYGMSPWPVPERMKEAILAGPVHYEGDDPDKDARARRAHAMLTGSPILGVVDGGRAGE